MKVTEFLFKYGCFSPVIHTKWWIIKAKHQLLDTYRKTISLMKINNIFIYLGFNIAFNTLYRTYQFYGRRKPVHTVGQGSVP